ncbi:hypothetical protein CTI14_00285 [Methylobacterium radiotolerans]|nr:hypothetical protein CTI14_00285 [Methylobacterium radiotolerans]
MTGYWPRSTPRFASSRCWSEPRGRWIAPSRRLPSPLRSMPAPSTCCRAATVSSPPRRSGRLGISSRRGGTSEARARAHWKTSRPAGGSARWAGATPRMAANENRRLRADQVQNLAYQAGDIVSSLGSGSNLSTVAFQQGPQIAQVFGGPGGASVKGAFAQAGDAASSVAARIGLVGGAFAAVTTAALAGVLAFRSYSSSQMALTQNLVGVGRASGATVGQINAIAQASARRWCFGGLGSGDGWPVRRHGPDRHRDVRRPDRHREGLRGDHRPGRAGRNQGAR